MRINFARNKSVLRKVTLAPISGEPGTARAQVRTVPLWGLRTRSRFLITASLEIVDSTGQTRDQSDFSHYTIVKSSDAASPK